MQCSAVQCSALQSSAVKSTAVQCSAVQCSAVQCNAVKCTAVHCNTGQCSVLCISGIGQEVCLTPANVIFTYKETQIYARKEYCFMSLFTKATLCGRVKQSVGKV